MHLLTIFINRQWFTNQVLALLHLKETFNKTFPCGPEWRTSQRKTSLYPQKGCFWGKLDGSSTVQLMLSGEPHRWEDRHFHSAPAHRKFKVWKWEVSCYSMERRQTRIVPWWMNKEEILWAETSWIFFLFHRLFPFREKWGADSLPVLHTTCLRKLCHLLRPDWKQT